MSATLGLYPSRRVLCSPAPRPGLTVAQSAELSRLQARYGRCAYACGPRGLALIKAFGDNPYDGEAPLVVVLDSAGRVVRVDGGTRRI